MVLGQLDVLTAIMEQDYPNPKKMRLEPTRYQVDMLLGLAGSLSALVEGHERG
jgi:hypothetical protein